MFDAVYNPAETRLQREAKTAGATPVSGVEMFIREAEEQFTLFTSGIPGMAISLNYCNSCLFFYAFCFPTTKAPGQTMRDVLLENLKSS